MGSTLELSVFPLVKRDRGVHYEEGILIFALRNFHFSIAKRHRGGFVFIRVISRLISFSISAVSLLCPLLLFSCTQPTDSTDKRTVERERIEAFGLITRDTVWERGKDYLVVGDVVVEEGSTLTIEPDVRIFFKANTEEDYPGLIVKGTLLTDGSDRSTSFGLRLFLYRQGTNLLYGACRVRGRECNEVTLTEVS